MNSVNRILTMPVLAARGFFTMMLANLTLVWSLYDRDYADLVGMKDVTRLTPDECRAFESALLPAPSGGRFRFDNPARCKQCGAEISGPM